MAASRLSTKQIQNIKESGVYLDGDGLELRVTPNGSKSWVMRVRYKHRRPEIGLGTFPETSLADARHKAHMIREAKRAGHDPRNALVAEGLAPATKSASPTFAECAATFIRNKSPEWSGPKQFAQWTSSIENYANPIIGSMPVDQIELDHVEAILRPHWLTKTETMARVRSRVENILSWSIVKGYRKPPNPAVWTGNLEYLFPAKAKVAPVQHHKAMDYRDVPEFMAELRERDTIGARALEFAVLTASRNTEVTEAKWGEMEEGVWTIPPERMKARKEHRVPITPRMQEILDALPYTGDFVFPGRRGGLSNNTLRKYLQEDMQRPSCTPHGFRSAFKDWAVEESDFAGDISEAQLAHTIRNATQASYERGDKLKKRRELMLAWEAYCCGGA